MGGFYIYSFKKIIIIGYPKWDPSPNLLVWTGDKDHACNSDFLTIKKGDEIQNLWEFFKEKGGTKEWNLLQIQANTTWCLWVTFGIFSLNQGAQVALNYWDFRDLYLFFSFFFLWVRNEEWFLPLWTVVQLYYYMEVKYWSQKFISW